MKAFKFDFIIEISFYIITIERQSLGIIFFLTFQFSFGFIPLNFRWNLPLCLRLFFLFEQDM